MPTLHTSPPGWSGQVMGVDTVFTQPLPQEGLGGSHTDESSVDNEPGVVNVMEAATCLRFNVLHDSHLFAHDDVD
jgi:hypothetical protein